MLFGLDMQYYHGLTIYPIEFLRANADHDLRVRVDGRGAAAGDPRGCRFIAVACAIEERPRPLEGGQHAQPQSVVGTIFCLFVDLRLRSRRGPPFDARPVSPVACGATVGCGEASRGSHVA